MTEESKVLPIVVNKEPVYVSFIDLVVINVLVRSIFEIKIISIQVETMLNFLQI